MEIKTNYYESPTKRKTRDTILNASFNLFINKGIQDVSMQEIADQANMQRRTLYNYYNDKDQIALDIMKYHYDHMKSLDWDFSNKTSYETVSSIIDQIYNYIINNPDFVVFTSYFDHLFKEGYSPNIIEFIISYHSEDSFSFLVEKNESDNSLNPAFIDNLSSNIHNLLIAMYAFAQKIVLQSIKINHDPSHNLTAIREYKDLILNLIRNNQ